MSAQAPDFTPVDSAARSVLDAYCELRQAARLLNTAARNLERAQETLSLREDQCPQPQRKPRQLKLPQML
jgi:hypothetical protein